MNATSLQRLGPVRIAPPQGVCPRELRVLRELTEYLADREVSGTTLLDAATVGRQAYLWTLSDGEHLLLLMQRQRFCYWQATREPFAELHARAMDWLTEPPIETSQQESTRHGRI